VSTVSCGHFAIIMGCDDRTWVREWSTRVFSESCPTPVSEVPGVVDQTSRFTPTSFSESAARFGHLEFGRTNPGSRREFEYEFEWKALKDAIDRSRSVFVTRQRQENLRLEHIPGDNKLFTRTVPTWSSQPTHLILPFHVLRELVWRIRIAFNFEKKRTSNGNTRHLEKNICVHCEQVNDRIIFH
jgi:hypothetical protein